MHKKNKHKEDYNFEKLTEVFPELIPHVFVNKYEKQTIDFADAKAVKALNTALLKAHYGIDFWQFPETNLCPPIPGRVDYIHHIAALLKASKLNKNITVLDIGTGASCIYPLLGNAEYNWKFVGTDCNKKSIAYAEKIIIKNKLKKEIQLKHQPNTESVFQGVITATDTFSASICNPPFYKDEAEAFEATTRKLKGLGKLTDSVTRNFAGQAHELCFKGGEKAFLHTYLYESSLFKTQCFWYTSLVSNKDNIKSMKKSLAKLGATTVKVIEMSQGNKKSRVVAWTFLTEKQQQDWNK
ncbi:23S rRNA (adenine(1618)-N(6))-methyltransferase RlmF [Lacinutrix sp. Bg11-31]|uniref:23S rRNA (adenine(1618)-N(6))-methyltransferase RlmF n=1 Tax=Lacinutrix sp. Bg11-31 TaxID=2057808 RepID=UPI000C314A0E|nr:23S rRNA (adenine(1618)-N(6))-methyltransferase RlmF [Lacinutrix sp. Bg11-31]AUC81090.1 23S rRNA (adenine(1618)-N(6))-methyltransferase RlmF [Lacinutrix sp. Bg11-31]